MYVYLHMFIYSNNDTVTIICLAEADVMFSQL